MATKQAQTHRQTDRHTHTHTHQVKTRWSHVHCLHRKFIWPQWGQRLEGLRAVVCINVLKLCRMIQKYRYFQYQTCLLRIGSYVKRSIFTIYKFGVSMYFFQHSRKLLRYLKDLFPIGWQELLLLLPVMVMWTITETHLCVGLFKLRKQQHHCMWYVYFLFPSLNTLSFCTKHWYPDISKTTFGFTWYPIKE